MHKMQCRGFRLILCTPQKIVKLKIDSVCPTRPPAPPPPVCGWRTRPTPRRCRSDQADHGLPSAAGHSPGSAVSARWRCRPAVMSCDENPSAGVIRPWAVGLMAEPGRASSAGSPSSQPPGNPPGSGWPPWRLPRHQPFEAREHPIQFQQQQHSDPAQSRQVWLRSVPPLGGPANGCNGKAHGLK